MPHLAIPVGLSFTPEAPLLIAILPFVIISFLIPLSYFLALIGSSLPAISLLLFHTQLLYYIRAISEDKNVTALRSIHEVGYGA